MTTIQTERQKLLDHMEKKKYSSFKIEQIMVIAQERRLKGDWTLDLAEDIRYILEEDDAND